jgi:hypothetical protein
MSVAVARSTTISLGVFNSLGKNGERHTQYGFHCPIVLAVRTRPFSSVHAVWRYRPRPRTADFMDAVEAVETAQTTKARITPASTSPEKDAACGSACR